MKLELPVIAVKFVRINNEENHGDKLHRVLISELLDLPQIRKIRSEEEANVVLKMLIDKYKTDNFDLGSLVSPDGEHIAIYGDSGEFRYPMFNTDERARTRIKTVQVFSSLYDESKFLLGR